MPQLPKELGRRAVAVAETRERILDAAERLFAEEGIEGTSLRQIGAAAGAANHFAVQYHFGDKRNLVKAIFERRLPVLEMKRTQMLAQLTQQGRNDDPSALLEILFRPLADVVDAKGQHSYAAFLLGLHYRDAYDEGIDASDVGPLTWRIYQMMQDAHVNVAPEISRFRLLSAFVLFLDALVRIDRLRTKEGLAADVESNLVEDAIISAKGAFAAPVAPVYARPSPTQSR